MCCIMSYHIVPIIRKKHTSICLFLKIQHTPVILGRITQRYFGNVEVKKPCTPAKAHDKIWLQQLLHLSLSDIPNAYNYVNGETGWVLPSDAPIEMYRSTTQLSNASTINADDTARTFTVFVTQIEAFGFQFIVNDDFYISWFQDQDSHGSIDNDQVSRQFHEWHNANDISNDVPSQQIWLSGFLYARASFLIPLTCITQENVRPDRQLYSTTVVLYRNHKTTIYSYSNGPSLQSFTKYLADAMDKPYHVLRFTPQFTSEHSYPSIVFHTFFPVSSGIPWSPALSFFCRTDSTFSCCSIFSFHCHLLCRPFYNSFISPSFVL